MQHTARLWQTILTRAEDGRKETVYGLMPMPQSEIPNGFHLQSETFDDYLLPEGYSIENIHGTMSIVNERHAACKITDGYYVAHPALIPPAWRCSGMAYPLIKVKHRK